MHKLRRLPIEPAHSSLSCDMSASAVATGSPVISRPQALARWAYSLLWWLLQPLVLLRLVWRSRAEPAYRHQLRQRFGFYGLGPEARGRLWVHAVSLGEARAAAVLVHSLRELHPELSLLLTHGTATGWQAGSGLLRPGDIQAWLPIDTPGATSRFLVRFSPLAGVLIETEIWPNLLHQARERGIPMVLANARLSERSLRKGRRLSALMQPALRCLNFVLAQSEDDAKRLGSAGVCPEDIEPCGNLKFDMIPNLAQLAQGRQIRAQLGRPVVLAASTREGEEEPLLEAWQQQRRSLPVGQRVPLLLLVPRHPQRFDEVARCIQAQGLNMVRKTLLATEGLSAIPADVDVCLGDSMGEMTLYYAMSDIALLGGSFAPLGGQNLIEAAACGCPIIMGPHTFNFEQAAEWALAAGAAQRVADMGSAVSVAMGVCESATAGLLSQRALEFAQRHRGASHRMAGQISARVIQPVLARKR
jgi:3-deoxy-D-manno-octulosonic-acid transferase